MRRQHVHFVNQINLETSTGRRVLDVIQQLPRVIDLGPRCRIHFNQIDETAAVNLLTRGTPSAGIRCNAAFAIQRLGKDPRHRRLADAPDATKQIRMMEAPFRQCIAQRLHHRLLPHQLGKCAWPPLSREHQVTHPDPQSRQGGGLGRPFAAPDRIAAAASFRT